MRLLNINEAPQWKELFCRLGQRLLSEEHRPFSIRPEYVAKILDLKFPVATDAYLLEDDHGEIFGRVLLQGSVLDREVGHFGLFCLSSQPKHVEAFKALWPKLQSWFHNQGIKKIIGPYLYTTFFPYRFRSDEHPERYSWEPNQPISDLQLFRELGFVDHQSYFSNFISDYGTFATKGQRELEEAEKLGFRMREISRSALDDEVKTIYELSMQGFTDNYLFSPIPYELFKSIYVPSFESVDLRTSCIQESPEGQPIGFNFTFVMDDHVVIKSVCVLPEFRGKGLLNAGIRWSMLKAMEHFPHVRNVATALIHEDNGPSRHVANQSQDRRRHEYVLLSKDI